METGEYIPELLGTDESGRELRRDDFAGRPFVLYFYPKDNTPGCTAEACSLRDHYEALRAAGWDVVGVSADSARSHQGFIARHGLPFRLIADTEHHLSEAMGTWVEKRMCGRTYMGMARTTFLVGPDGRVRRVYGPKQIKTKTHGEQLLHDLQAAAGGDPAAPQR